MYILCVFLSCAQVLYIVLWSVGRLPPKLMERKHRVSERDTVKHVLLAKADRKTRFQVQVFNFPVGSGFGGSWYVGEDRPLRSGNVIGLIAMSQMQCLAYHLGSTYTAQREQPSIISELRVDDE